MKPKVFIAHGGFPKSLTKLRDFLEALGVEPILAEVKSSGGRGTESQFDNCIDKADCAIVFATDGQIVDKKSGKKHPRLNVVDELGRCRRKFPNKTILLLQSGVALPSNDSGIIYEHFIPQSMDRAFIKVAKELREFGIIKVAGEPIGNSGEGSSQRRVELTTQSLPKLEFTAEVKEVSPVDMWDVGSGQAKAIGNTRVLIKAAFNPSEASLLIARLALEVSGVEIETEFPPKLVAKGTSWEGYFEIPETLNINNINASLFADVSGHRYYSPKFTIPFKK